ncbi:UDP-N-acetylmuramoylalanine--D-glutamate ligase [Dirofilaria immitis]
MAENFHAEALVLMVLTYVILIIIILRTVLMLCQYTFKSDQIKRAVERRSLSLQKVISVKSDENKQNSNRNQSLSTHKNNHEYHERPSKSLSVSKKHQRIPSKESKFIHPVAKQASSSMSSIVTQFHQGRTNDDDSFWQHSFQESELSKESTTIPNTSAYGMRKIGKKVYIDDTNIGSPGSKKLEQKSYESIEEKL